MKTLIVLFLFPVAALAVQTKPVYNCDNWAYRFGAYVCASAPAATDAVDTLDLQRELIRIDARISALDHNPPSLPLIDPISVTNCLEWAQRDNYFICSYPASEFVFSGSSVRRTLAAFFWRLSSLDSDIDPAPHLREKVIYRCPKWTNNYVENYCIGYPFPEYVPDDNSIVEELILIELYLDKLEGQ